MNQFEQRFDWLTGYLEKTVRDRERFEKVLKLSGISRSDLSSSRYKTPQTEAELIRQTSRVIDDNTLGVQVGLQAVETGSLTSYIGRYSRTLRAAIENSQRYYSAIDPSHSYTLRISGNSASFEVERTDPLFAKYHRYTEFLLFGGLTRMRKITGVDFFPIEVRFDHDVKNARDFERLVGVPVVFGAEKPEIILPLSALDLPVPTYDPSLRTHLMEYGERLLSEQPEQNPSLRSKVEGILLSSLPGRIVPSPEVASSLGMSNRTFARRLSDENLSFRSIVDELRCDLAKTYLSGGYSASEIAYVLDYSDQAAFSSAFKRWTGISPSSFKRKI